PVARASDAEDASLVGLFQPLLLHVASDQGAVGRVLARKAASVRAAVESSNARRLARFRFAVISFVIKPVPTASPGKFSKPDIAANIVPTYRIERPSAKKTNASQGPSKP